MESGSHQWQSEFVIRPSIKLLRVEESFRGTLGVLIISDLAFCVTLELPDLLNKRNISNIPTGQYVCEKILSPKFGETFEITNVPNRSGILFHAGNIVEDTKGCVIIGQHFGKLYGDRAVINSGNTFKKFIKGFKNVSKFSLTIKEVY